MTRKISLVLAAALLATHAFAQTTPATPQHGIDLSYIDTSVVPGDDFYHFADGIWIKNTPIPADRAALSVFSTLADRTDKQVASIIGDVTKSHAAPNSDQRKIADLAIWGRA